MVGERIEKNISDTSPKCVDREGLGRRFTTEISGFHVFERQYPGRGGGGEGRRQKKFTSQAYSPRGEATSLLLFELS